MDTAALKEAAEAIKSSDYHALDAYLSAANPSAILSLIERVEALEEALRDIASEDIDRIQDTTGPVAKGTLIGIVRIARAAISPTNTQADE